ncbi:MAG: alginate export family protein [Opitutaceae bacterium]|nr:alginate export family protein [Cytophagales bacterium]
MIKSYIFFKRAILIVGISGSALTTFGQQRIIGTVRPRAEYRDGTGNLPTVGPNSDPAMFVSQRSNLLYGYKWTKLDFQVQLRDVRVWGQDASTISNNDGSRLFLHEAWGDFTIATASDTNCWLKVDNLSLKVGRQEIVYDDVRLLGNLDWLQQGRRHDAAVLKFLHRGYQVDLGAAFNQNTDAFGARGIFYNPQNNGIPASTGNSFKVPVNATLSSVPGTNAIGQMYKMMQYMYASRKWGQTKISGLVFKDDFAKYTVLKGAVNATTKIAAADTNFYNDDRNYNSRWTMGGNFSTQLGNASSGGKLTIAGGGFIQRGNNKAGANLEAYMANLSVMYQKGKFQVGPAIDYLSGNNLNSPNGSGTDNRFDPLYGTPHRWWGYMDYYYAGTGGPIGGLINSQIRARYTANRYFITVDYHNFMSDMPLKDDYSSDFTKDLGNEIDVVLNYNVNKFVNLELGYSKYFGATESTALTKGQTIKDKNSKTVINPNLRREGDWAYAMITIRPDFLFTAPVAINPTTMNTDQLSIKVKELQDQIDEMKTAKEAVPAEGTTAPATNPPSTPDSK